MLSIFIYDKIYERAVFDSNHDAKKKTNHTDAPKDCQFEKFQLKN